MKTNMPDNTASAIVHAFFDAWMRKDGPAMRALMADDLAYANPLGAYATADAFLGPLLEFSATLRRLRILEVTACGDRAAVLYDCECAAPVGNLRTAWFVRVEGEKLRTIESVFDATELRKVYGTRHAKE